MASALTIYDEISNIHDNEVNEKIELILDQIHNIQYEDSACDSHELKDLKLQLTQLGVKELSSSTPEDIDHFTEMMILSQPNSVMATPKNFDFSMILDVYTIWEYDGTRTVNGKDYNYLYYIVFDNKGYVDSPLTVSKLIPLIPYRSSIRLGDLMSYNFSFGVSALLGKLPYGWAIDWLFGNIFTAASSYNENLTVSTNSGIYAMNITTVTTMTYYYIQVNGTWYEAGSRAYEITMARVDSFTGNIGGQAVSWQKEFNRYSGATGRSWYWYVEEFVKTGDATHHPYGSFTVNGYNGLSSIFTPGYAQNPWHLI